MCLSVCVCAVQSGCVNNIMPYPDKAGVNVVRIRLIRDFAQVNTSAGSCDKRSNTRLCHVCSRPSYTNHSTYT